MPQFLASCPWVTLVGGTYNVEPEKALVFSGGGFSNRFARSSWQNDAVNEYLCVKQAHALIWRTVLVSCTTQAVSVVLKLKV